MGISYTSSGLTKDQWLVEENTNHGVKTLSIELRTDKVYQQKLEYIHENPVNAAMCKLPEEYKYSSALFYHTGIDNWGFLTHHRD